MLHLRHKPKEYRRFLVGESFMSVNSSKKISSVASPTSKASKLFYNNRSQFVENVDTTNNVFIGSNNQENSGEKRHNPSKKMPPTDFNSASPDISTSIKALTMSGLFELDDEQPSEDTKKINVYNNNQTIIKDEEVERTGRNYLKHFYEKNEHLIDVDELV